MDIDLDQDIDTDIDIESDKRLVNVWTNACEYIYIRICICAETRQSGSPFRSPPEARI